MPDRQRALGELLDCLFERASEPSDWTPVLQLAAETLTIGTLAQALLAGRRKSELPDNVEALLADVLERARKRNERLEAQFNELLPELNAASVEPIPMRGMARLLASADASARLLSDIDILVPEERLHDCAEVLAGLGYSLLRGFEGGPFPLVFGRSSDVGSVDVHARLQPHYLKLDHQRLAPHCRGIAAGGGAALLPSPTCQMLFIIVHDQLHDGDYWRGLVDLRHMVDMAHLIDEGIDWDALAGFFPPGPPRNALHVQLRTARSLLDLAIPDEHCGGAWAELQVARRRVQARHSGLMSPLTLLSMAIEPPPRSKGGAASGRSPPERLWSRIRRRVPEYLRPPSSGKLQLRG